MELPKLLRNLSGKYKGNVTGTPMNVGLLKKTGNLDCIITDKKLEIISSSVCTKKLSRAFPIDDDLKQFFTTEVTTQIISDVEEKRVAFMQSVPTNYGFWNKWLGGMSATRYAYQLKFVDDLLIAIRIQSFHTSDIGRLLYFLEMINLEKIPEPPKISAKPKIHAARTDWNFE